MHAIARLNPFDPNGCQTLDVLPGMTLAAIARADGVPRWFADHGEIRLARGGKWVKYDRAMWPHVKPKPGVLIELRGDIQGGKGGTIFLALAAVALTVATAGIGAGALGGVLGAGFGAGTLGASLAAAGIGLAGQLALRALTPSPAKGGPDAAVGQDQKSGGVAINGMQRGSPIPGVLGRMEFSPDLLIPPYVTMERGREYSHAMVGVWGRCMIENIKINGTPIDQIMDLQIQVFEGDGSGDVSFLSGGTRWTDPVVRGATLKAYDISPADNNGRLLVNQKEPAKSSPDWLTMKTNGVVQSCTARLLFTGAMINSAGDVQEVAVRTELRRVGTSEWIKGPTLHFKGTTGGGGGFRQDITFVFSGKVPHRWTIRENTSYPAWNAFWNTGDGEPFEHQSASYFDPSTVTSTDIAPAMSSNTFGGITTSASHNNSTAWHVFDGTGWSPPAGTFPVWWKIDWGSGNAKKLRRIAIGTVGPVSNRPGKFRLLASADDVTYTELMSINSDVDDNNSLYHYNFFNDTSYRYYKLEVDINDGQSTNTLIVGNVKLYETNLGFNSWPTAVSGIYSNYVAPTRDGFTIILYPSAGFDVGEYEIRIKRSASFTAGDFSESTSTYSYAGFTSYAYFFDYSTSPFNAARSQTDVGFEIQLQDFISISDDVPINPDVERRLARIAVRVPDIVINSITATFTSYAHTWNGTEWSAVPVPTRNNAALWRDALLQIDKNATPLPGEILDSASLEAFYDWCEDNAFTCDAVVQDRSILAVLRLLGSTARASVRQSDMWGVVIDQDRTAEPFTALLTPETSRDEGTFISFDNIPHGLRVTYLDEDDDYIEKEVEVYRAGFTSANATDIESLRYEGITSLAKATAQAVYDLAQMHYRKIEYRRSVSIEGQNYARGEKIGLADEVLLRHCYYGLIAEVFTSGGNVTGFRIYGTALLSESSEQIGMVGDIDAEANILSIVETFGAAIRLSDGEVITAEITETADTSTITLDTPITDDGRFVADQPVAIGPLGREVIPTILRHKEPTEDDGWRLYLVPEAPEIHA